MCFSKILPFLVGGAPMGLQALGTAQAERATMRAHQAERERQRALEAEQQGLFADSLSRAAAVPTPESMADAIERRRSGLAAVITPAGAADYLPGSDSASPVVRTDADRAGTGQRAEAGRLATTLAGLTGTGDQLLDLGVMTGRNAQRIGQASGFMRGSLSSLDTEMEAARHKGETLRGLGQLAQQLAMALASGGAGAPGALSLG